MPGLSPAGPSLPGLPEVVVGFANRWLGGYHRHEIHLDAALPDEPALVVGNHGFGGVVDLNVWALVRTLSEHCSRPVTFLVHSVAWSLGVGRLVEAMGGRPASPEAAREALSRGEHVVVFPGGDLEAAKPWRQRNTVRLAGRTGFAGLARDLDAPIVPVVTAGAGESLLVLSDGTAIADRLGLAQRLRLKAAPVTLSLPWGLSVGVVGLAPYLPLPTKLSTAVLPPITGEDDETDDELAGRVAAAMQSRLDELVAGRVPVLG